MDDEKILTSPAAKAIAKIAEAKALKEFNEKFPLADKSQFVEQTDLTFSSDLEKHAAKGEIFF